MGIITLLTDFGTQDGFVGIMKGVIWRINPQAQIADLTHEVTPQNILEGALTLARCVPFFPPGTVHIAVVDPGVGSERRPMAARLGSQFFVGPDNGLITLLLEKMETEGQVIQVIQLDQPRYWLDPVSRSFHGRDIFAPAGAHLSNGIPLQFLGSPLVDPVRLIIPQPESTDSDWQGQIVAIDHFGNCATNLPINIIEENQKFTVEFQGHEIHGMVKSYAENPIGELIALIDSDNRISIAIVNGNAAQKLQARLGDPVKIKTR
jgi:S-adenosyl-L-methionine hydrolase (adenosine-forming)